MNSLLRGGLCGIAIGVAPCAFAATVTVNTTEQGVISNGNCSLDEAVNAVNLDGSVDACTAGNGADTLVIQPGLYARTSSLPVIEEDLIVVGTPGETKISFNGYVFRSVGGLQLKFEGIHFAGGYSENNDGGSLHIAQCVFENVVEIQVTTALIESSEFFGSRLEATSLDFRIVNSTFHDQSPYAISTGSQTDLAITHSTFVNNAIVISGDGDAAIRNSLFSSNSVPFSGPVSIESLGYNLTDSDYNFGQPTDIIADPQLFALANLGGATRVYTVTEESPAIDQGTCIDNEGMVVDEDQRGLARFEGLACDIGALEIVHNVIATYQDVITLECPMGGIETTLGIDYDEDGDIDGGVEIEVTCLEDIVGDSLIDLSEEPPGANCAEGGVRIDVGIDDGDPSGTPGNAILESGEIDETFYVCNGEDGLDGQDGEDGLDGQDGLDGEDGAPGANGEDGADGAAGADGGCSTVPGVPAGLGLLGMLALRRRRSI